MTNSMARRPRILKNIGMKFRGRLIIIQAAALLLTLQARPANTAFGEKPGGVELAAEVIMTSDPAAAPVLFSVKENPDPFADPEEGLAAVTAWQIQVIDLAGRKVGFIQGKGRPPAGVLLGWIEYRFGVSREEAERIEYVLRWKIAKKGTKGAKMFEKTLDEDWPDFEAIFQRYGVKIAKELSR